MSLEEVVRALAYGNAGRYGKVFNELRSVDVVNWLKGYRKVRNKERIKHDQVKFCYFVRGCADRLRRGKRYSAIDRIVWR